MPGRAGAAAGTDDAGRPPPRPTNSCPRHQASAARAHTEGRWPARHGADTPAPGPPQARRTSLGGCVSDRPSAKPQLALEARGQQTAPGTTCGNHRADYPRHLRTSLSIVFAGQVHEPTL
jgi:hypothetical protein